jgi:TolA-binding protein
MKTMLSRKVSNNYPERKSVSKLTKMFENKTTEVTRKSAQNKDALKALKDDLNKTYNETEEIDDIFDDLTMPNTVRKRTNSVLDKVQMFNKTDIKDAQKILKTVSQIASDNIYV